MSIGPYHFLVFFCLLISYPQSGQAQPQLRDSFNVNTMTLDEKVGQLFIIGFPEKSLTPALERFIYANKPGSFILFKRNLSSEEQIKCLNDSLNNLSLRLTAQPPLIAIDQEGGQVSRIKFNPPLPSARAVGAGYTPGVARDIARSIGSRLSQLGINMNLAPVLDVDSITGDSFIGSRSYGSHPLSVAAAGVETAEGLIQSGIIPTAKHFPGLGPEKLDPHQTTITRSFQQSNFGFKELFPFIHYTALGPASAIMISQLSYPQLDPSGAPASFSKIIMNDLLRKSLGYDGLIVTDDLQMKGSALIHRPEEAALTSLLAGADMVMLTWSRSTQAAAIQRTLQAVRYGEFPVSLLDEKVRRILRAKQAITPLSQRRGIANTASASEEIIANQIASSKQRLFSKIASLIINQKPNFRPPLCIFSKYSGLNFSISKVSAHNVSVIHSAEHVDLCGTVFLPILKSQDIASANTLTLQDPKKFFVFSFLNEKASTGFYGNKFDFYFYDRSAGQVIGQLLKK